MFQMMGVFAEFERAMIQGTSPRRSCAGQERGKALRPSDNSHRVENAIREALSEPGRPGVRKIAARFGVDPGTVQRISRPFEGASTAML